MISFEDLILIFYSWVPNTMEKTQSKQHCATTSRHFTPTNYNFSILEKFFHILDRVCSLTWSLIGIWGVIKNTEVHTNHYFLRRCIELLILVTCGCIVRVSIMTVVYKNILKVRVYYTLSMQIYYECIMYYATLDFCGNYNKNIVCVCVYIFI